MEKTSLKNSSVNLLITNIFPRSLTIFTLPIFLRLIDDNIWGEISFLLAIQLIFSNVLLFGSESTGVRFFGSLDKNNKVKLKNRNILTTFFSVSFLLIILELLVGSSLFKIFDIDYGLPAKLALLTIFFLVTNRQFISYFKSINKTAIIKKSIYVDSLVTLIFQFLFVLIIVNFFGFDDRMLASAYFLGQLFGSSFRLFYLTRKLSFKDDMEFDSSDASMNKYALYGYLFSIFSVMLTWQDRLIIQYFFDEDIVAHYSTVYRLIDLHGVVVGASVASFAPFFWNIKNKSKIIISVFKSIINLSTFIGLTGVIIFELFGRVYFPTNYHYAIKYVPILTVGLIFSSLGALFALDLDKRFANKQRAISIFLAFLVNLIVNLTYIEKYGIIIAAASSTIAYFVSMIWNINKSKISLKEVINFYGILNFFLILGFYILVYVFDFRGYIISLPLLVYSLYFLSKEIKNYKNLSERLSL